MSRTTSSSLKAAASAQETSEVFLILLEISHADITTLRFVNNYTDIIGPGAETYIGFPFDIIIPSDDEQALSQIKLTIDNVDRSIMDEIRSLTSAPDISVSVILASDPTTIEAGPFEMKLRNVDYNASTISGNLQSDDILNEPWPGVSYVPANFPGLWA